MDPNISVEVKKPASPDEVDKKLNFLHHMSNLKHLERAGWVRMGIKSPESVAGHMYRMGVMALFMINDPNIDTIRCLKMCLAHDMGESIIGDITPVDNVDKEDKQKMELNAIKNMSSLLPDQNADQLLELFLEYEENKTPEAKLVKDLDKFDMVLQAYEYELQEKKENYLEEFFESAQQQMNSCHPAVKKMYKKLHERREQNIPFDI